ncbi:MAG: ATP-dependent DNA helicase [Terriglobales bacterium]
MPPFAPQAAATLKAFFARGGALAQALGNFEYRPGQCEMAEAVERALAERRHLLVEAGTGTGKTLAYLAPVLASGRRVLISTGTKNLQDQLIHKDIPLLARAVGRPLKAVCLKGRNNYACRAKIADLERQPALLGLADLDRYRHIRAWAEETATGDRAELEDLPEASPLWERLNARRDACTGAKCRCFDECFLTSLRQRAMEADLVVANHHLFFADLAIKSRDLPGVLPPYEAVVLDEAHELEDIAGQYFGVGLSNLQLNDLATDGGAAAKFLAASGGGASAEGSAWLLPLQHAAEAGGQLFTALAASGEGRAAWRDRPGFLAAHQAAFNRLRGGLAAAAAGLDAVRPAPEELEPLRRRLRDTAEKVAYLFTAEPDGVVFWHERRGRGVYLQATPIAVAALLEELLFAATDTVILTSATLAIEGRFDYVRQRLGVPHGGERVVASSFDYERQALLYLPEDLPDPRASEFPAAAAEEIAALLACSQGRAFVLSTSHEQMRELHRRLAPRLPFPTLLQGDAPRHILLERFRQTPGAVLFGTSSFWQGVDVQGKQLSCVIVDKLPFAAPTDPVLEARIRALEAEGRNAFTELQLPQAVLALKQGFGRLIRSRADRGVLALLDGRILRQRYGAVFLDSLPPYRRTRQLSEVRAFFAADAAEARV